MKQPSVHVARGAVSNQAGDLPLGGSGAPMPQVVSTGTVARESTVVLRVMLLLPGTASGGLAAATVAVFEIVPCEPRAVTRMSKAAEVPLARGDTVQVIMPSASRQRASAETDATPAGSGRET